MTFERGPRVRSAAITAMIALAAGAWGTLVAQRMDAFVESRHHPAIGWEARLGDPARTKAAAEALADYLLFVGEAPLAEPVKGQPAFAAAFTTRGPRDTKGRSLRDLQLDGRMMRYPLSYMVYTPMFDALPDAAAGIVRTRMREALTGQDVSPKYGHVSESDRQAIVDILRDTKPGLLAAGDGPL